MSKRLPLSRTFLTLLSAGIISPLLAQTHSVARRWNDVLIANIRKDFARPPVQARNLFQISAAMYDAWAAYTPGTEPWLLGHTRAGYACGFSGVAQPVDVQGAQEEAISYAAYRMMRHRYLGSPGAATTLPLLDALMDSLGYDRNDSLLDYVNGGPAELGNYIAASYLAFGLLDGANEAGNYVYQHYAPVNPPMRVEDPGDPTIVDPNRWQPITLTASIDQQGNPVEATRPFIGPEWGEVLPFAMTDADMVERTRDGYTYKVYHDPGPPAYLDTTDTSGLGSFFKWNHVMVPIWQSHLDPADTTLWDISPGSIGNNGPYPSSPAEYEAFYDYFNGNDAGQGRPLNPVTGQPYAPQLVKRGDYTRVLAEFWADGPNSETPPGHWYTILHAVSDHPLFQRKWMGEGEELDPLAYDIKSYFALGGALHDAAIAAWGIKGWYDSVRPVSAIRYMADHGQCSDSLQANYHPQGLPLIPGYIELVPPGDPLAGDANEHVGKIKLNTWRGPSYISNADTTHAGVGWILAENWFPYQRPTFVTPPFAGFVSGHSTYSRSAAEVLTAITGDPYFPGGMSNFVAPAHQFLVFEDGPSEDVVLQWATYRDASDQCSLSRIWGGIHPPMDDIPGRMLGQVIGPQAVTTANALFDADRPVVVSVSASDAVLSIADIGSTVTLTVTYDRPMLIDSLPGLSFLADDPIAAGAIGDLSLAWSDSTTVNLTFTLLPTPIRLDNMRLTIGGARSAAGIPQNVYLAAHPFLIDTEAPLLTQAEAAVLLVTDAVAAQGTFSLTLTFSEACDTAQAPALLLSGGAPVAAALQPDALNSGWTDAQHYVAAYFVNDTELEQDSIAVDVQLVRDEAGNPMLTGTAENLFAIDTHGPALLAVDVSDPVLSLADLGSGALTLTFTFDQELDTTYAPALLFTNDDPLAVSLTPNPFLSGWTDERNWQVTYDLANANEELADIQALLSGTRDKAGNEMAAIATGELFTIDTHRPIADLATPSVALVADQNAGTGGLHVDIHFSEGMDPGTPPLVQLSSAQPLSGSFQFSPSQSSWLDGLTFRAVFNVSDAGVEVDSIGCTVSVAKDLAGNVQTVSVFSELLALDTRNPLVAQVVPSTSLITNTDVGVGQFLLTTVFDEPMDQGSTPLITFAGPPEVSSALTLETGLSYWSDDTTYVSVFTVNDVSVSAQGVGVAVTLCADSAGNPLVASAWEQIFSIELTSTGLGNAPQEADWRLFPNPWTPGSPCFITLPPSSGAIGLQVFDARGELVLRTNLLPAGTGPTAVRLPDLSPGIYQLEFSGEGTDRHARRSVVLGSE